MNELLQVIVATLGGGALGGIAGAIATYFASKQKIKELEYSYRQKLRENYDENMKRKVETLFKPISIHITRLINDRIRYTRKISAGGNKEENLAEYKTDCSNFVDFVMNIYENGEDVYLPKNLDFNLRRMQSFISNSIYNDTSKLDGLICYVLFISIPKGLNGLTIKIIWNSSFNPKANIQSQGFHLYIIAHGNIIKETIKKIILNIPPE